jgi:hypothetical protein
VGEWIEAHSGPDDVTLGSLNTGEVLSGILPGRVVIGRRAGTIAFPEKLAMVEEAYRGELTSAELLAFLRANRVTYIVVGPEERKLGPNDPGSQLRLQKALQIGGATAYHLPEAL